MRLPTVMVVEKMASTLRDRMHLWRCDPSHTHTRLCANTPGSNAVSSFISSLRSDAPTSGNRPGNKDDQPIPGPPGKARIDEPNDAMGRNYAVASQTPGGKLCFGRLCIATPER